MGVFDFLKPKSALEKAAAQVREPFMQPDYRRQAMDTLMGIGTTEAYEALLKRFTIQASGQIADEEEKRDLVEMLAARPDESRAPLEHFVRKETKHMAFPLKALVKIMGAEEGKAFVSEVLQQYEPLDHRSTQAKLALLIQLADMATPEDALVFVPYLEDHADDVQFQAVDALERLAVEDTAEAIAKVCASELHGGRVKRRAAAALQRLGWSVKKVYATFDDELKDTYLLGKKGQLVSKRQQEEA